MAMTDTGLFSGTADSATSGPQSFQPPGRPRCSLRQSMFLQLSVADGPAGNAAHAWAQLADEALLRGDQDTALDMISWAYRCG